MISLKGIFYRLSKYGLLNHMSDKLYLKIAFKLRTGKKLNLVQPQTFNEKLQWLKINDRKEIYTKMVDKFEVKEFIKEKI